MFEILIIILTAIAEDFNQSSFSNQNNAYISKIAS